MQQSEVENDISIKITLFLMKCSGFWLKDNQAKQNQETIVFIYTIGILTFATCMQIIDFYNDWNNTSEITFRLCTLMTVLIVLSKILILSTHRRQLLSLVAYMQRNFWINSDGFEGIIVNNCKKKCVLLVCSFTIFSQGTSISFLITPIIANIGKNESDRVLPFKMWINLPLSMTPYFEISFAIQAFTLLHVGMCYYSFDNLLCIMNVHTAGQFRILQKKLMINFIGIDSNYENDEFLKSDYLDQNTNCINEIYINYKNLKGCIHRHQILIRYCNDFNNIFTFIILGQVTLLSLLLCLTGFSSLVIVYLFTKPNIPMTRRLNFAMYFVSAILQLITFTYSCQDLIEQSCNVGHAAYSSLWETISANNLGITIRKDVQMIIMRTRKPCYLSAGGFFPITLQTYTTVVSTAMSYYTLLRQTSTGIIEN